MPRRMKWDDAMMITLGLCAVITTSLVVRRELFGSRERVESDAPVRVPGWRQYIAKGHMSGPTSAPVTLVVFGDYQCPFCQELSGVVDSLREVYPTEVRVIERNFPLEAIHPQAHAAALAAECAADVGQFASMRHALYTRPDLVERSAWGELGTTAGIRDTTTLKTCVASHRDDPVIQADVAAGNALGVTGTPTVLVNDTEVRAKATYARLDSLIRASAHGT